METLRKNILAYYGANFLLIIAQSLPHAILTPLLLSKGLSLSEILLVQTFFSFCVLVAEYPSGVLADLMSRKNLFLVSNAFLIASFSFVLFFDSFIFMLLAWGLYGLYSACSSGTIEASLITGIKEIKGFVPVFSQKQSNRLFGHDYREFFGVVFVSQSPCDAVYRGDFFNHALCANDHHLF